MTPTGLATISLAAALLMTPTIANAQAKPDQQTLALFARAPADLVGLVKVTGDSLDPQTTISTQGVTALTTKGLLASTTTETSFLRAFINRKTGAVSAQVYQRITYGGRGFQSFPRATYEAPEGIEEAAASEVDTDVSCGRYSCLHYADVIFPIKLDVLRAAAKAFDPAAPLVGFRYRIFGQSGTNTDEVLPGNEVAAFVSVIDREVAALKR